MFFQFLSGAALIFTTGSLVLIRRIVSVEYFEIPLSISFLGGDGLGAVIFIRITGRVLIMILSEHFFLWIELMSTSEVTNVYAWVVPRGRYGVH